VGEARQVKGTEIPDEWTGRVFVVCGDTDDHLRLSTLLAIAAAEGSQDSAIRERAALCRRPGTAWSDRIAAITEALHMLGQGQQAPFVLVDPDALFTGSISDETRWDDRAFRAAREDFRQAMLTAAARGGWRLLRPAPRGEVSVELKDCGVTSIPIADDSGNEQPELLCRPQPEARPLLRWLLGQGVLSERAGNDAVDANGEGDALTDHLAFLVFDSLTPKVRFVANRLATLRLPQQRNGHYGSFASVMAPTSEHPEQVPTAAIAKLCDCGFLQRLSPTGLYRMPRGVRRYLAAGASFLDGECWSAEHRRLAALKPCPDNVEEPTLDQAAELVELHHHAIEGGDTERAAATARFYANDLRQLAFQLSKSGRFEDSARVYSAIIEADTGDAYAWEYLAYNLARTGVPRWDQARRDRIRDAYGKAVKLQPFNPLFRGRVLGFLAEEGLDVQKVSLIFEKSLRQFDRLHGNSGVSYFAESVIQGLARAQRFQDVKGLFERHGGLLFRCPRLADLFHQYFDA
jgi:tetratricopeptide (TPR) repeat protein